MMSGLKTWSTKEEVLRDLAEATGRRVGDLDEEYFVVGQRPPPKHATEEEDDEMNLLFGGLVNGRHVQGDSSPDLEGITEMLRMVNDYDVEEEGNHNGLVNPADAIITISKVTKLNPNVREFVPKSGIDSSSSSNNLDYKENVNNNNIGNINSIKADDITGKLNKHCNENIDAITPNDNNVESDDVKVLKEKIKKQISDSLNSDSFENKKQKNVAIATLLKLNASKGRSQTTQNDTKNALKLMTPDDFRANVCIAKDNYLTAEHPSPKTTNSLPVSESNSKDNESSCSTSSSKHKTAAPNRILSPEVKASIEKVNKWLEEPTQKKSPTPAVFSSPVGFKRKETKTPKSPANANNVQNNVKPNSIEQYKPSKYAADLTLQYIERSKAKNNNKRNNWSDLDIILKEKDQLIKQRLEEKELEQRTRNNQI